MCVNQLSSGVNSPCNRLSILSLLVNIVKYISLSLDSLHCFQCKRAPRQNVMTPFACQITPNFISDTYGKTRTTFSEILDTVLPNLSLVENVSLDLANAVIVF